MLDDWSVVVGKIKITRVNDDYWLTVNEGEFEGEGQKLEGDQAKKFERLIEKWYQETF